MAFARRVIRRRNGLLLEGSLEYQFDGKAAVTLKAGEALLFRPDNSHGEERRRNGAELATYIVEKGKPLVVLAK